jgi:hypothetical protein
MNVSQLGMLAQSIDTAQVGECILYPSLSPEVTEWLEE